ncbi:putative sporulation protein YtxC [Alkaliphilus sp. MSJ-5]|uniref:Sporulation protein YtxC n=1 Tax=Alkaliphilus flagellatus TaxID=2841507 RepID=A0ABS6G3F9_9FIRM|nr:putative sporulation protein YtxC [Alkaliphilus flagellatus]MBU5677017.1 putative sporulation protein YtxC [Alkaliphilus flagellatus]
MNLLAILAERSANKVQEKIQPILESFYNEGIDVEERIYYIEPLYYLNYSVDTENIKNYPINDFINIFKFCIANALCEYIKDIEEPSLIRHIISTDYYYFDVKERLEIYKNSLDILNEENIDIFFQKDEVINAKSKILQHLIDYLNSNTQINLSGFILFRLKDYLLELNETVEKAVEDFIVDKEYNEFIKLLKYFVDIQEAKSDIVNVVFDEEAKFRLYDKHSCLLNNDHISSIAVELAESNINQDDLLISALITLAPKEIFIHNISVLKTSGIIKTLEKIFPDRIHCCNSCEWCTVQINANKE